MSEITFHYTNDEFINEGAAEIAYLMEKHFDADVSKSREKITICSPNVFEKLRGLFFNGGDALVSNTHRRSSIARYYNSKTEGAKVPSSNEPFPDGDEKLGEKITEQNLENEGIPIEGDIQKNVGQSIYTLNPWYTGVPISRYWETSRVNRYIDALENEHGSDYDADIPCSCCAREDLPNWKYDGEKIEYNQSFTPFTSKSGLTSLGQKGSQGSSRQGRCVACLISGFAYTLSPKPFYTTSDRDYRIFTIQGGLDTCFKVRKDYEDVLTKLDSDVSSSNSRYKVLSSNVPVRVKSDEGQFLALLCQLVEKSYSDTEKTVAGGRELVQRINSVTMYTSTNAKSGKPVRGISSIQRCELVDNMYGYVTPIKYEYQMAGETMTEEYWLDELLNSLSNITEPNVDNDDKFARFIGQFSNGILREDVTLIENGLFGLAKPVVNQTAVIPESGLNILGAKHYVSMCFKTMTQLTDDELESLGSVGNSLGNIFSTRDDVSVLISLKNANNAEQFLSALEQASIESMKKGLVRGEQIEGYSLIWNEDLETVMKVLNDEDRFTQGKSVLVSHASLAALYNNSKSEGDKND